MGQLKRRAPDAAGTLEKGSQQGWVWGAREARIGGLGWSPPPSACLSLVVLLSPAPSITDDGSAFGLLAALPRVWTLVPPAGTEPRIRRWGRNLWATREDPPVPL